MGGSEPVLTRIREYLGAENGGLQPYTCQGCETEYEVQYHICPNCGSYTVERSV